MFLFYSFVPILLKISGSTMLNLSLLTSDMWAVFIRIFAYNEKRLQVLLLDSLFTQGMKTLCFPCGIFSRIVIVATSRHMCSSASNQEEVKRLPSGKIKKKISSSSTKTDAGEVLKSKNREVPNSKDKNGVSRAFVMRVSDKDLEIDDHLYDKAMVVRRFACDELILSDSEDSNDEPVIRLQTHLMPHVGYVEGALSELTSDRQLATMAGNLS